MYAQTEFSNGSSRDTISLVLSFLDHRDLDAAGVVCHAWHEGFEISVIHLWQDLLVRDFAPWQWLDVYKGCNEAESKYKENYSAHIERLHFSNAAMHQHVNEELLADKQAIAACLYDTVRFCVWSTCTNSLLTFDTIIVLQIHVRILIPSIGVGLLLLSIFVPLYLDGVVKWSLWLVCLPIWTVAIIGIIAIAVTLIAERYNENSASACFRLVRQHEGQESPFLVSILVSQKNENSISNLFMHSLIERTILVYAEIPWQIVDCCWWCFSCGIMRLVICRNDCHECLTAS